MGRCKRRSARRLNEYAWVVKPIRAFFEEKCSVHYSGVGWKQFMMLLCEVYLLS